MVILSLRSEPELHGVQGSRLDIFRDDFLSKSLGARARATIPECSTSYKPRHRLWAPTIIPAETRPAVTIYCHPFAKGPRVSVSDMTGSGGGRRSLVGPQVRKKSRNLGATTGRVVFQICTYTHACTHTRVYTHTRVHTHAGTHGDRLGKHPATKASIFHITWLILSRQPACVF